MAVPGDLEEAQLHQVEEVLPHILRRMKPLQVVLVYLRQRGVVRGDARPGLHLLRNVLDVLLVLPQRGGGELLEASLGAEEACRAVGRGFEPVGAFDRSTEALGAWLATTEQSGVPELRRFCNGVRADFDAVLAGHPLDPLVSEALAEVAARSRVLRVFGSYPASTEKGEE